MLLRWCLPLVVSLWLLPSPVRAAYPLVVDDAAAYAPGEMQMDFTLDGVRGSATELLSANYALTLGLWPGFEGSISTGYGWLRDRGPGDTAVRDGVLDTTLGFKSPLLKAGAAPFDLSVTGGFKLPTASAGKGLGTGHSDAALFAILTWNWGRVSLDVNAGHVWAGLGENTDIVANAWNAGVAVRCQATEDWMLFVETYADLPSEGGFEPVAGVRAGAQVEVVKGWLIGFALGTGYGHGADELLATMGLSIIF